MSLLFAFSVSDPERVRCALHPYRAALRASQEESRDGWGLGFYQGDDVLLRRNPRAAEGAVDFCELARELRTDVLVGHVGGGQREADGASPFRCRNWMGAHCGVVPRFEEIRGELLEATPDFLRRSIRGKSDSEHLFHLVLAFLHDSGKLDDPRTAPEVVGDAIRAAVRLVDRAVEARGGPPPDAPRAANLIVTNGRVIAALRRGQPLHVVRRSGVPDCPVCREENAALGRVDRPIAHELLRSVLVLSDRDAPPDIGGEPAPDDAIVLVDRSLNVSVRTLGAETR